MSGEARPSSERRCQVLVIGSGAGGSAAACALAEAGLDTLLLDEGPHHDPSTFTQVEGEMMERLYVDGGRQFNSDQSIVIMSGRGIGGSTIHNTGLCVPPPRSVLARWSRDGALPVSEEEFLRVSDSVLERLSAVLPDRSSWNRNNELLALGADRLGLEWISAKHNRTACSGCGYCILGCAYNRKRHAAFAFLEPGQRAGLRILGGAQITRLSRRDRGWVAQGPGVLIRSEKIVLAASAIGTPALLLRSGIGQRGLVGRSLRLHPFAPVVGVFDEPIDAHRGIPQTVLVTGHADFLSGADSGYLFLAGAAGPAGTAALLPGLGNAVREGLARWRHGAYAGVLLHDVTKGRVRPRRDGRARIDYFPEGKDRSELLRGVRQLAELWFEAGAREVMLPFRALPKLSRGAGLDAIGQVGFRPYDVVLTSVHPQGSVPAGGDARTSALRPDGEVRGAPGLYVADASAFCTSVGVPPQVSIMTWALVVARGIVE